MIDCYVVIQYRGDPRFDTLVFEGHVGLADDLSPAVFARELEDMAWAWGYDSDDVEIEVTPQDRDFDWVILDKSWYETVASEILQSSGDLSPEGKQ